MSRFGASGPLREGKNASSGDSTAEPPLGGATGPDYLGLCHPDTRLIRIEEPLELESGGRLDEYDIAFRTWGDPSKPAVLVCHALTGSADVDDWWPMLIEEGGPLDPQQYFVLCSNVLGSCYGSSGPSKLHQDGKLNGLRFPRLSIRDVINAQARWLGELGVKHLHLVVGGSMGGMQVLEWAALFPERVSAIAPVAVSALHSPWCIGISHAQRRAIASDSGWRSGVYSPEERPENGIQVARQIAMISYRSHRSFYERFGRRLEGAKPGEVGHDGKYSVESYLDHHGLSLKARFDPASYYRLTQTMDSHDIGRGRGGAMAALSEIEQPALIVGIDSDVLYPLQEQQLLCDGLPNARLEVVASPHGHDGFLIEQEAVGRALAEFVSGV